MSQPTPATAAPRTELTVRGLILGVVITVLFTAANVFFGLQAGLFTRDVRRIFRAYEELEVGGVIVDDVPTWRIDPMPYGGVKHSGFGREGLKYAIEEMTEPKLLVLNLG